MSEQGTRRSEAGAIALAAAVILALGLGLHLAPGGWSPLFHLALPFAVSLLALRIGRRPALVAAALAILALLPAGVGAGLDGRIPDLLSSLASSLLCAAAGWFLPRLVVRPPARPADAEAPVSAGPSLPTPAHSPQELIVLEEIARTIGASLDLSPTLRAILVSTRRLIAFDMAEVTLWDPTQRVLVSRGSLDAEEYHAVVGDTYHLNEGYSGWLARHRQPLLIPDVAERRDVRPKAERTENPLRSYLGIPLESRGEFVGTLELASFRPGAFTGHDLELLQAIGVHAATAIEHARLYEETRRRTLELASLTRISATLNSTLDLAQVLQTIAASVLEVVGCHYSAIFVLDEESGMLRLAATQGLSPAFAARSRSLPIERGGRTHAVASGEPVLVEDISADPTLRNLAPLATDEGVVAFADIPLRVGEQTIGMLSVSFTQAHRFTRAEQELLFTFADQAAIAISNAKLYARADRELRQRSEALGGLQRVAQEVSVTIDPTHILRLVMEEAHRLSGADRCAILLHDAGSGRWELKLCIGYLEEEQGFLRQRLAHLPPEDALAAMAYTGQTFQLHDAIDDGWPIVGQTDVRSALLVPIAQGEELTGAIVLNARRARAFDEQTRQFIETLATQAAIAISSARNYEEQADRTALIRRRADQLGRVLEVSQAVRSDQPLEQVLEEIAYAIQESVGFDLVLISLVEGDPPHMRRIACAGIPLSVFDQMKQNRPPLKSLEVVMHDEFRLSHSYYVPAEQQARWRGVMDAYDLAQGDMTRQPGRWHPQDMLLIPLIGPSGRLLGMISVDEPRDGRVPDLATVEALEVFAAQAAVAIENAQMLTALQGQLETLSILNEISHSVAEKLDLDETLWKVVGAVTQLVNCQGSVIFLQDPQTGRYVARAARGHDLQQWEKTAFASGEGMVGSVAQSGMPLSVSDVAAETGGAPDYIQQGAAVLVPLSIGGQVVGVLTADRPQKEPFSPADVATVTALADQVALAVQNARLYDEATGQAERLALVNRIAAAVGGTLQLDSMIETVYEQIAPVFQPDAFFIALYDEENNELDFRLQMDKGKRLQPERRALGSGLASAVVTERKPLLIRHFTREKRRLPTPVTQGDIPESWLGVPMRSGDRVVGVISVQAYRPNAYGEQEAQLLSTIADQIGLAVQNARLFDQAVRRSEELSTLVEAGSTLSFNLDLTWVLQALGDRLLRVTDAGGCLISEWARDENQVTVIWELGDPTVRPLLGTVYTASERPHVMDVLLTQEPLLLDAATPDLDESALEHLERRRAQAILILPMVARGQTVGLVELERRQEQRRFSAEEVRLAQALANQAAAALQNARMYEEIVRFSEELEQRVERRTHELAQALEELTVERDRVEALYRITAEVYASLDLDQVLNRTLELVARAVGASRGSILLDDPDRGRLIYRAATGSGITVPIGGQPTRFRRGEGLAGWAMVTGEAALIEDVRQHPRWVPSDVEDEVHRAALVLPLKRAGEIEGAMLLFSPTPGAFTENHLRLAEAAAVQIANAVGNAALYKLILDQTAQLGAMLKQQQVEAAKSQAVLEGVADGVVVADAQGRIILFNAAAERILEIPRQQALGRSTREMIGLYGVEGRKWLAAIEEWSAQPTGERAPESFVAERLELGERIVAVHVAPVTMGSEYLGTVSVFRDITAVVAADRAKSEFVSTVSHELRTPMTSIKGYADLVLMGAVGSLTEQQKHFIGIIRNNADRLTELVNDLLDISRIETGRIQLEPKALDMHELVEQVISMLEGRARNQGLTLISHVSERLPAVWGDSARIVQILTNLIGNAVNYTPSGGTVTVSAQAEDNKLKVMVSDTGIGIAHEDLGKIFGRFFRADHPLVQEKPGTGLGLPITASLVQMHGGEIWVESELGKGSTFFFTLPLARSVQAAPTDEPLDDISTLVQQAARHPV